MSPVNLKRHERRRNQKDLLEQQRKKSKNYPFTFTLPNRKSDLKTVEKEDVGVQLTIEERLKVFGQLLPGLLTKLSQIQDPRRPKKIKHQLRVLMFYGIMIYVFQVASRRQANREMTTPRLLENLQALLPELVDMPHQDTLCRLLEKIDVSQIETVYIAMLKSLIRKKKFQSLLHRKRYLVAVDGTQKYVMDKCYDQRYLRRRVSGKDGQDQYYAYVLEAVLLFSNGMVLPLTSEFLENSPELEAIESDEEWKQDCELKAFYRLAKRLKNMFPKLSLTLLLDGLYANGPVMAVARKNKWKFMIVLKDGSLPSLWQEAKGLMRLDHEGEYRHEQTFQGRRQVFSWVNEIEYQYGGPGRGNKTILVHLVLCEESFEKIDQSGAKVIETARHAWLSSDPLNRKNVHESCNLVARKRWLHENNILKEKHQRYHYEHIFSHDFNAMRGYHYLMHIGRMLNEMAVHSVYLTEQVRNIGIQMFIKSFHTVMANRALNKDRLRQAMKSPGQLRLVQEDNWKTRRQAA